MLSEVEVEVGKASECRLLRVAAGRGDLQGVVHNEQQAVMVGWA